MWTISWLQLKHSWRQWLATIPVFVTVGLILGFCLTGIVNVAQSQQVDLYGPNTPLPIFIMPVFFGGITMVIVIKGIVHQLLDQFKTDYRMLAILGGNDQCTGRYFGDLNRNCQWGECSARRSRCLATNAFLLCVVAADCWAPNVAEYANSFFVLGTFVNGCLG